ncbi:alcohol dehydrogenase [Rhizobium rhizosphaerae]|uniref:Alcohol dehydrogenase n=1 Tax=Xaviernesmea rhizosphaerae TaxID=1672749 RepID=A0ABX3PEZ3_9HYPH|nr:iron-containing alcohol dehydrogenase [Xaviernesmea rhizosphaerae]OQP86997.1 alcohol dehydrogenase [Xaviernesmea rhizosphaerae]
MHFTIASVPEIRFGPGLHETIGAAARAMGATGTVALVIDSFLMRSGLAGRLEAALQEQGLASRRFSDFSGEPKLDHLRAADAVVRGRPGETPATLIIGVGGGSALDIAKIVACTAASGEDAMHFALAAHPLPRRPVPTLLMPTTAGTGSETSATNIFTGPEGRKLWIWGPESKADLVVLDPTLTLSLPPDMTAWCGLDAFVHAFEAATNRKTHAGTQLYAHRALAMIAEALPAAIARPDDLTARGALLLASCYAGIAIDLSGTAIAHHHSHALAGLAPVHHGLATALAFELTLPWLVEADTVDLHRAALACGLPSAGALPGFVSRLMDAAGIVRRLPPAFATVTPEQLMAEMQAPEHQPMRAATVRPITETELARFSEGLLALT